MQTSDSDRGLALGAWLVVVLPIAINQWRLFKQAWHAQHALIIGASPLFLGSGVAFPLVAVFGTTWQFVLVVALTIFCAIVSLVVGHNANRCPKCEHILSRHTGMVFQAGGWHTLYHLTCPKCGTKAEALTGFLFAQKDMDASVGTIDEAVPQFPDIPKGFLALCKQQGLAPRDIRRLWDGMDERTRQSLAEQQGGGDADKPRVSP